MLTQTAEYALRAVVSLAETPDRQRTSQQLAETTKVPQGYLSKVMQMLVKGGLVTSQRGHGGGFLLAKAPSEVTILDVLNATDTPVQRITECPLGLKSHVKLCGLHQRLDDTIAYIQDTFGATTIDQVIHDPDFVRPLCEVNGRSTATLTVNGGSENA